jgi:GrpE
MALRARPWSGLCLGVAVVLAGCAREPTGELRSRAPGVGSPVQPLPTPEPFGLGVGPLLIIGIGVAAVVVAVVALVVGIGRARRRPSAPPAPDPATAPARAPAPDGATTPIRRPAAPARPVSPYPADDGMRAALRHVAAAAPSAAIAEQIDRLLAAAPDRSDLVEACIRFRDQLSGRDPALAAHLRDALGRAGVVEIGVEGEVFDARSHEAVGTAHAPDAGLHGRVAEVVRPGYRNGEHVVQPSRVVVYRADEGAGQ